LIFTCSVALQIRSNILGLSEEVRDTSYSPIIDDVWNEDCESLSQHCLSEWLVIPAYPILFGLFQFVYFTNRSIDEFKENVTPDFVCFNRQQCPMLLAKIVSIKLINGLTCCHWSNLTGNSEMRDFNNIRSIFSSFHAKCLRTGIEKSCQNSSYFHCNESMKCIPYHCVGDGMDDCYFGEDELFDACQLNDLKRYKCKENPSKCLSPVVIGNGIADCPLRDDEMFIYAQNLVTLVSFPHLCNIYGNYNLRLLDINETDETDCDWWPCNNPYTRCDQIWHCSNGADELNCPDTKCSYNEHQCQNKQSGLSYCIPLSHIYDKYLDCSDTHSTRLVYFYNETTDISEDYISWNNIKCITLDKLCRVDETLLTEKEACLYLSPFSTLSYIEHVKFSRNYEYLCNFNDPSEPSIFVVYYFKALRLGYSPKIPMNDTIPNISKPNQNKTIIPDMNVELTLYCHRGILIRSGPNQTKKCLCPPNYFGSRCQWQNQRISLTLQLVWRSTESINVIFQVIIMIIDEDGQISPYHEQITYMPTRDCNTKFNIYLLYRNRPKSLSNNYSIRIDLYEKTKLNYWSSWFIEIPFQFLPVNRIVSQLIIPENKDHELCSLSCGEHGKCQHYINNKSLLFCQCDQKYSGSQCQIKYQCNCANDSFCFDSSICICPLHKFGLYCHLTHSIYQSSNNPCHNNGTSVPIDDRIGLKEFSCFCSDDYSGERCQNKNNQIDIHLNKTIIFNNSLVLLHFITAFKNAEHERITVLKKIPFDDKNLTVYVKQSFNILFIQILNQYYLAILREIFIPSEHIYTKISSNQRCLSIVELNNTFLQYKYLQRAKYYPLLCRKYSELKCFYDTDLMCICDIDRFSNCFLFNQTMNNDCQGYNYCQNDETCPTKSICICQDCYYGAKCQLSTKGFIFSLDSILGYHIKPNLSINQQPLIIKISIAITTIMFILGLINGLLSFLTFRREKAKQVGTGYYLLFSSITSIFIIILLTIKFWELILSQMSLITNRSFLYFNCILVDVILKILLSSNELLNACVAFERMISVIKGPHYDRQKSKKISKWIILSVFIFTIVTHIHDPIHRELIDDIDMDENRIWCFIKYSSSINIYNSFITLFHFLIPFIINIISAICIILKIAINRSVIQCDQTFQQHLHHQIKEHRHILIASFVLILLNLPRLIISFLSGCMRSAREPWLYLIGYFISFIPSMLTLIIFILPSKTYKDEFDIVIKHMIRRFRRIP
jgi:hypothetical protein